MIPTQDMTYEQRAVLRACEERFMGIRQVESPMPQAPPPVYVRVCTNSEHPKTLEIQADGTTRAFMPGYMGVPTRLYGKGKNRTDVGLPKYAKKYMPIKGE